MFNLNLYEFDTLVRESGSILLNFVLTIVGAGLGFLGAYYLYIAKEKKDKREDDKRKIEQCKKRLSYLNKAIDDTVVFIENQLGKFSEHADKIESSPNDIHYLGVFANHNLHRLQNLSTEDIFVAYQEIVPDSTHKIDDFNTILGCIDYLYMTYNQTIDSNAVLIKNTHKDQIYIKDQLEYIPIEMLRWMKRFENENSRFDLLPGYLFLRENYNKYNSLIQSCSAFPKYENDFVLPFGDELRLKYNKEQYFFDLYPVISRILVRYSDMRTNSLLYSKDLKESIKVMKKSNGVLSDTNKIISTYNTTKITDP